MVSAQGCAPIMGLHTRAQPPLLKEPSEFSLSFKAKYAQKEMKTPTAPQGSLAPASSNQRRLEKPEAWLIT